MKAIAWSYPTSPNAERFHFKAGCWTVEEINPATYMPTVLKGFRTFEEAKAYADTLPLAYYGHSAQKPGAEFDQLDCL